MTHRYLQPVQAPKISRREVPSSLFRFNFRNLSTPLSDRCYFGADLGKDGKYILASQCTSDGKLADLESHHPAFSTSAWHPSVGSCTDDDRCVSVLDAKIGQGNRVLIMLFLRLRW